MFNKNEIYLKVEPYENKYLVSMFYNGTSGEILCCDIDSIAIMLEDKLKRNQINSIKINNMNVDGYIVFECLKQRFRNTWVDVLPLGKSIKTIKDAEYFYFNSLNVLYNYKNSNLSTEDLLRFKSDLEEKRKRFEKRSFED